MSERQPPECERVERFEIVYDLRPHRGRNEYKREDGTIVHGDASREWTLDESGGMRTLCFASPRENGLRPERLLPLRSARVSGPGLGAARARPPLHSRARARTHPTLMKRSSGGGCLAPGGRTPGDEFRRGF